MCRCYVLGCLCVCVCMFVCGFVCACSSFSWIPGTWDLGHGTYPVPKCPSEKSVYFQGKSLCNVRLKRFGGEKATRALGLEFISREICVLTNLQNINFQSKSIFGQSAEYEFSIEIYFWPICRILIFNRNRFLANLQNMIFNRNQLLANLQNINFQSKSSFGQSAEY